MALTNRYPSLSGKNVLITGGGTGIGACLVEAFAEQGARVCFIDILAEPSTKLVDRLNQEFPDARVKFYQADLLDISKLRQVIKDIDENFGGVSILVNNAASDTRHHVQEITPEYWDERINTNLRHYFFAIQAIQPQMQKLGGGSIINMGSMCWHDCHEGLAGYSAAKAGVVGLTRGLAKDLGKDKIRINTITPGWVMTERQLSHWINENTMKKIEENQCIKDYVMPEDIAAMALFLASEDSKHCTAQDFIVDGGWI
ncbi:SDR family NAD(P)-dependent oxidoreductase [Thalassotalea mangrovi]|uniref:SDR family oxidoreductase n=1 Tax=Thalassotalea mangrovi TaxID=2572245 RepID=A0A4U1B2S6_9GAMM|nr:SDR family oxidoreductase [Thalassotalea mangrovi]TKB43825.1 SDR family oxidoreductase [Thalassotalea mangrovi]